MEKKASRCDFQSSLYSVGLASVVLNRCVVSIEQWLKQVFLCIAPQVSGNESLKARPTKPVKVAESDVDVSMEENSIIT